MDSHPECWHRETPRSTRSAHGVTPQLLMHTGRCTHHNRTTQVVIRLADCPPEVKGRHSLISPLSITAQSGDALYLDFSVLTEMCVDSYLVDGRESRETQYTLQAYTPKQKCGGDCDEKYTAVYAISCCYHKGVCRCSRTEVKNKFYGISLSFFSNFPLDCERLPVISKPLVHSYCASFI